MHSLSETYFCGPLANPISKSDSRSPKNIILMIVLPIFNISFKDKLRLNHIDVKVTELPENIDTNVDIP